MMKVGKVLKAIWYAVLAIAVLLALGVLLLQLSPVQTFLGRKAAAILTENTTDARITLGKLQFKPFTTLVLKDIVVVDTAPLKVDTTALTPAQAERFRKIGCHSVDTLFKAEFISAGFTLKGLTGKSIEITRANVKNAEVNMVIEKGENFSTNLTRIFRIPEKRHRQIEPEDIFSVHDVEASGLRFTLRNYCIDGPKVHDGGICWSDLDVRDIDVKGHDLKLRGKVMSGELEHLSFTEKSGYRVIDVSGRTVSGQGQALVEDFHLVDPWSEVDIPRFSMDYDGPRSFANFMEEVTISADIRPSHISAKTLGQFAPALGGIDLETDIVGRVTGTVDDINIETLTLSGLTPTDAGGTISGRVTGLPDIDLLHVEAALSQFRLSTQDIQDLMAGASSRGQSASGKNAKASAAKSSGLASIAPGTTFTLNGDIKGRIDSLHFDGDLRSNIGLVTACMGISGIKSGRLALDGRITTEDLDLKSIHRSIPLNQCTLVSELHAKFPARGESLSLSIDTLRISSLNFNGYNYSNIIAAGILDGDLFNGKVACNDPSLNFIFQGRFSFSPKVGNSIYQFYANVGFADLQAMNFDRRGRSQIRFLTNANFTSEEGGKMQGTVDIYDLVLENDAGKYDIGDIRLISFAGSNSHSIGLTSNFAEGNFTGSAPISTFFKDIVDISARRELPYLFDRSAEGNGGRSYELTFRTFDTMDLLSFLSPGVYIADNTSIKATVGTDGDLECKVQSRRLAYKEQYIKDFTAEFNNRDSSLNGLISGESIYAASMMMKNTLIEMRADDNFMGIEFSYDNQDELGNRGELVARCNIDREDNRPVYNIELLPSSVYLNSKEWIIYGSDVRIAQGGVDVGGLEFRSGEESITADGRISSVPGDTLDIWVSRLNINPINYITGDKLGLKGRLSGQAGITMSGTDRSILLDLVCADTEIGGERLGDLSIGTHWNPEFRRFDLSLANRLDGRSNLSLEGNYTPSLRMIDIRTRLDSLNVGYAQPFLDGIFSDLSGTLSGDIIIEGPTDRPDIRSAGTRLDDIYMKIAYTNVGYSLSGPFSMNDIGINLHDISVTDRYGNTGSLNGKVGYDHFRNMNLDLRLDVNRIEAVDIPESQADAFYGHLFATGTVSITGPMNAITISADARTAGDGEIHIPVNSSLTAGSTNLLRFTEPQTEVEIDPYEQMMSRMQSERKKANEFAINLRVNADPRTEAFVEIDKASGNILRGRGNGTIELGIVPSSNMFDIRGDYTISSGNFHFVALGIATRDFTINEDSSIRFNGDVMESALDISATYRTKASLSTLIADTTSVNNRRTVDCGIRITEKLSNPRLSFSIDVPDIDPTVKARVESALSTEDKVQKQFLYLLLTNSFLPDEQSGISNNSSVLLSNVSELMSNQLNNIFQKLNIPIDLGLNYQQNDRGTDIFDVAVSTQLFNNRVVVNGNIGNRQYQSSGTGSEVVGDIDIEIKIDRAGAFRLNLFSHSADQYTNYLDNSQRNGVGVTYQQEFDHFGRFLRSLFQSRKKKEALEMEEAVRREEEEMVEFFIDRPEPVVPPSGN